MERPARARLGDPGTSNRARRDRVHSRPSPLVHQPLGADFLRTSRRNGNAAFLLFPLYLPPILDSFGGGEFRWGQISSAMAELFLWAAAGSFALVGYTLAKRLGLLDPVPRDPKARVEAYSWAAVSVIKDQLLGSDLQHCESARVSYLKDGLPGELWFESGALFCKGQHGQESFPIGDLGDLDFSYSEQQIHVKIRTAETAGAEHSTQISLRMHSNILGEDPLKEKTP